MEEIVRLRGHHVLCLLGFRGLGYSEEFVENMSRVHSRVFSGDCEIEIVSGADDICRACPKLSGGRCGSKNASRIDAKDSAVASLISVSLGSSLDAKTLYRAVADAFTPESLSQLCSECRWKALGYCSEGLGGLLDRGKLPEPLTVTPR